MVDAQSRSTSKPVCHDHQANSDWLLRGSLTTISCLYVLYGIGAEWISSIGWLHAISHAVFDLMNTIWWGIALGVITISILGRVPREFVASLLGTSRGLNGIIRATLSGVLLDLCSHGILMVGAKFYERGASIGQVIAFLVSSPWNSFSLTLILIALIGLPLTLAFIALSACIAIVTGWIFDTLVRRELLPENPNKVDLPTAFRFWPEARSLLRGTTMSGKGTLAMLVDGVKESRMVLRWILFGVLLASVIRGLVSPDQLAIYFGPTIVGLGLTLAAATIIEVCSEGSTPIAADLVTRAHAPGNGFAFLMGGVSTDYTEVLILKETTQSWWIAACLPIITLPQVVLFGWLINEWSRYVD